MNTPPLKSRLRAGLAYPTWLPAFFFFLLALPLAPSKAHGLKNAIFLVTFLILLCQPIFSWLYSHSPSLGEFDKTHAAFALSLNTLFFSVSAGLTVLAVVTLPLAALWYFLGIWLLVGLLAWLSAWTLCSTVLACLAILGLRVPNSLERFSKALTWTNLSNR